MFLLSFKHKKTNQLLHVWRSETFSGKNYNISAIQMSWIILFSVKAVNNEGLLIRKHLETIRLISELRQLLSVSSCFPRSDFTEIKQY